MAVTFESHPFWDFSYGIYGKDGVSPALIGFQDRHGMDVNMLFLCLWMGHSGRGVLDTAAMAQALAVSRGWNPEIVCGLRALRIRLRSGVAHVPKELSDAVRRQILEIEIDCEHVEQMALAAGIRASEDMTIAADQRLEFCLDNLAHYFKQFDLSLSPQDRTDLVTVLAAAFPELDRSEIERRCKAVVS